MDAEPTVREQVIAILRPTGMIYGDWDQVADDLASAGLLRRDDTPSGQIDE